jgi:hypothetical protein
LPSREEWTNLIVAHNIDLTGRMAEAILELWNMPGGMPSVNTYELALRLREIGGVADA